MTPFDFYMIGFLLTLYFNVVVFETATRDNSLAFQPYEDLRNDHTDNGIIIMILILCAAWPVLWPTIAIMLMKKDTL